jgi:trigger factor
MQVLRKRYGQAVTGEVVEQAMNEAASQTMTERGLRPALTPQVEVTSFQEGGDLEYKMAVELLPEIAPPNFGELALERLKVTVTDEEVDKSLARMAQGQLRSEKIEDPRPAANGDVVMIDFVGKIDGKPFPGGAGTGTRIELGANQFIPGFEDQLLGAEAKPAAAAAPAAVPSNARRVHHDGLDLSGSMLVEGTARCSSYLFGSVDDMIFIPPHSVQKRPSCLWD